MPHTILNAFHELAHFNLCEMSKKWVVLLWSSSAPGGNKDTDGSLIQSHTVIFSNINEKKFYSEHPTYFSHLKFDSTGTRTWKYKMKNNIKNFQKKCAVKSTAFLQLCLSLKTRLEFQKTFRLSVKIRVTF